MNHSISTALCLAASDVNDLIQGRMIAAISRTFISAVPYFALCSVEEQGDSGAVITAWASLELCQIYDQPSELEKLAAITTWSNDQLLQLLTERYKIFLACLRVHTLPEAIQITSKRLNEKIGGFIKLPNYISVTSSNPILSDRIFAQRKHQLENLEPPEHPEIEALHSTIVQLTPTNPSAIHLEQDLKCFLGWAESEIVDRLKPEQAWIHEIAQVGNSSDGDRFEKLVRRSFVELGFQNSLNNSKASLDPNTTGGAGGIDIYCESPYSLVGECKASKHEKVPSDVAAQLTYLGQSHLGKVKFDHSIKVLFVAGRLTNAAEKAAVEGEMNVMRPETLERLVTLKSQYPGAVNLFELEACLKELPFGEASNEKINSYLDRIQEDIEVRSKIVQVLQRKAPDALNIGFIQGHYEASNPPRLLNEQQLKEILIELSSPLTGFIGRKDGDRFYFLRPFHLNTIS